MAPNKVGVSKNSHVGTVSMTITGLEPAGGCTVRVSCMTAMAVPTASAMLHQIAPNSVRNMSPMNDDIKCPAITLRGCENGLSGKPNSNTQLAPNEPNIKGVWLTFVKYATVAVAKNPPIQEIRMSLKSCRGGH